MYVKQTLHIFAFFLVHLMMTSSNGNIFRITGPLWGASTGRGALIFSLICAWRNHWANNRDAGVSRRHRVRYDIIVMWVRFFFSGIACGSSQWCHMWCIIYNFTDQSIVLSNSFVYVHNKKTKQYIGKHKCSVFLLIRRHCYVVAYVWRWHSLSSHSDDYKSA